MCHNLWKLCQQSKYYNTKNSAFRKNLRNDLIMWTEVLVITSSNVVYQIKWDKNYKYLRDNFSADLKKRIKPLLDDIEKLQKEIDYILANISNLEEKQYWSWVFNWYISTIIWEITFVASTWKVLRNKQAFKKIRIWIVKSLKTVIIRFKYWISKWKALWKKIKFDKIFAGIEDWGKYWKGAFIGFWSSIVSKFKSAKWFKRLENHFNNHWKDFWARTKEEYLKMAENFARDDNSKYLIKINKIWDSILKYDKDKNIYISINKYNNVIRTFYKPDLREHKFKTNLDYFNAQ